MRAEGGKRENPLTRSMTGMIGIAFLAFMIIACVGSLPWTLGVPGDGAGAPRYVAGDANAGRIPPAWWPADAEQKARLRAILPLSLIHI